MRTYCVDEYKMNERNFHFLSSYDRFPAARYEVDSCVELLPAAVELLPAA